MCRVICLIEIIYLQYLPCTEDEISPTVGTALIIWRLLQSLPKRLFPWHTQWEGDRIVCWIGKIPACREYTQVSIPRTSSNCGYCSSPELHCKAKAVVAGRRPSSWGCNIGFNASGTLMPWGYQNVILRATFSPINCLRWCFSELCTRADRLVCIKGMHAAMMVDAEDLKISWTRLLMFYCSGCTNSKQVLQDSQSYFGNWEARNFLTIDLATVGIILAHENPLCRQQVSKHNDKLKSKTCLCAWHVGLEVLKQVQWWSHFEWSPFLLCWS